jgi:hypothetical protein
MPRLKAMSYRAGYPEDHTHALTLIVQHTKAGWVARLLDHRTPNESELFSTIVFDPKDGKALLEKELTDLLTAEHRPQTPINWTRIRRRKRNQSLL